MAPKTWNWWTMGAQVSGVSLAGAVVVPKVATGLLTAVGCTTKGIAAHSVVAAAQSVGATGGFAACGPLGVVGAALFTGGFLIWKLS